MSSNESPAATQAAPPIGGLKAKLIENEQIVKYFLIGASASALDVILFFIIYNMFQTSELVAQSISVPTAVIYSFIINARHNFRTNDYMWLRLFSFCVVALIGYGAGYGVIIATQQLGQMMGAADIYHGLFGGEVSFENDMKLLGSIGKILSLPVVFIIQYVLNSKITFRKAQS